MDTAEYAGDVLNVIGLYNTAYLAGLLHDMGKYKQEFDDYIEKCYQAENDRTGKIKRPKKGSVNHTFAAVKYLLENLHGGDKYQKLTCELIAYACGAHHGQFDFVSPEVAGKSFGKEGTNGFIHRMSLNESICYEESRDNFLKECASEDTIKRYFYKSCGEIKNIVSKIISMIHEIQSLCMECNIKTNKSSIRDFCFGLIARLLLSAVVYGDRRDTIEFSSQIKEKTNNGEEEIWRENLTFLEKRLNEFNATTEINKARRKISDICKNAAHGSTGIYRLNAPTGAGKTLATLRFALSHAIIENKKRIIFIIPLLSILDQNVKVIKENLLDNRIVLEHHSDVVRNGDEATDNELKKYELMTSDWNSEIIVSTQVQFLNILFSGDMSAVRRFPSLVDSVIVLDEVQTIPVRIIHMFNMAMNFLSNVCHATIVLSSATQPIYDKMKYPIIFDKKSDILPCNKEFCKIFERATVLDKTKKYGSSLDEIAVHIFETICFEPSVLIICNKKNEAARLFEMIFSRREEHRIHVYHLSTSMCMKHRQKVLKNINSDLELVIKAIQNNGKPAFKVVCVSTQLCEAGVDFSFARVIRISAGLDHVIQSAGRCNRSQEYGKICETEIYNLQDENLKMLPDISREQSSMQELFAVWKTHPEQLDNNIAGEKSIKYYYKQLYKKLENENGICNYKIKVKDSKEHRTLIELLSTNNEAVESSTENKNYILRQALMTAGNIFEVFEDDGRDVIAPYDDVEKNIENMLCSDEMKYEFSKRKELIEKLKPYTVRVFEYQYKKLKDSHCIVWDAANEVAFLVDETYDDAIGLKSMKSINEGIGIME